MSARRDEDELFDALKKIPDEKRRLTLKELLKRLQGEAEPLRAEQEKSRITELRPKHRVTELRGLGKDLWYGGEAQEYVDEERNSWHE